MAGPRASRVHGLASGRGHPETRRFTNHGLAPSRMARRGSSAVEGDGPGRKRGGGTENGRQEDEHQREPINANGIVEAERRQQ